VRVIAAGRASEIVDLGDGRVLRRFKRGGRPAREAEMLAELRRRPWRSVEHTRTLAQLHARLHQIPFEDERLLHLDLHPDNVMLTSRGPVVIDWTNAAAGDPAFDVALMWVIAQTVDDPRAAGFARDFVAHFPGWERALADAVAFRLADGLSWALGGESGRVRTETDLSAWRAARGAAGRMPPIGFPRTNRFG
jgi:aminoglycoside phosphotransferase (APT) family kinase protein